MHLFVTGSTGFIGSHFVRAALAAGHEVTGLRFPGTQPVVPIPDFSRLTWVEGDLNAFLLDTASPATRHSPLATSACSSALVHLAAAGVNPKQATWDLCFDVNLNQSLQLWRRAAASGIKQFVICGSCFEYGMSAERYDFIPVTAPLEPTGAYHASKAAATMAAYALGVENKLKMAILRPFHVFGEGEGPDRFWPSLRKAALAGEDFPMSPGEQIRDFIPVEQVAQAFLKTLDLMGRDPLKRVEVEMLERNSPQPLNQPTAQPLIANVGTGRPQTLRAFAEHWWKKWGATGKLFPGALPYRDNEVMRYVPEVSQVFVPTA